MGTRSLTVFKGDDGGQEIAVLYRQFDGYPSGHGNNLKTITPQFLTNGLQVGKDHRKTANGMSDLAVRTVCGLKMLNLIEDSLKIHEDAGNFYLEPAGTRDMGEEWVYVLSPSGENVYLEVIYCHEGKTVFSGYLKDFNPDNIETEV